MKLSWQIANANANSNGQEDSNRSKTVTTITEKDKIRLQAAALANDCYKYIMDLTTNGVVVITGAIKFVQTNKERLTMSKKEDEKRSGEPDYSEDEENLEEEQDKNIGETEAEQETTTTTNQIF